MKHSENEIVRKIVENKIRFFSRFEKQWRSEISRFVMVYDELHDLKDGGSDRIICQ